MFDDILGSKEEFYEGDENPIEFEYEEGETEEDYPPKYGGSDDEQGIDFDGLDESMKKVIRDFINQHGDDDEDSCDKECDDCDAMEPVYGEGPTDCCEEAECDCKDESIKSERDPDDPLNCRVCGEKVSVPKAVHYDCYEKLVKENKWKGMRL
jgi:hypothetical protein